MQFVGVLGVVLLVPGAAIIGGMPGLCGFHGLFGDATLVAELMVLNVIGSGQKIEISGGIVCSDPILVMDMESVRDGTAVGVRPNKPVKADAAALEILAAQVVASAKKLLARC